MTGAGSERESWWRKYGLVLGLYAVLLAACRPYYVGDSVGYVEQMLGYRHGELSLPKLWDFGHVLIRPLAWLMDQLLWPLKPSWIELDERLFVASCMIAVGVLSGAVFAVAMQSIATTLSGSPTVGRLVALGLVTSNALFNYSQTGNAYIPGTALLTVTVWFVVTGPGINGWKRGAMASLCLAAAVLFWFPYVLAIPAVLVLVWRGSGVGMAIKVAVWTGLILVAGYMGAILAAHLTTVDAVVAWYQDSKHGILPRPSLPRLMFGMARSFLNMGDEGIVFKRYLRHDPYAPAGILQLLSLGLLKTGVFYLAMLALGVSLRVRRGAWALSALVAVVIPVALFALFLFDPGSPERYLPFYPFVGICAALVFARDNTAPVWMLRAARSALLLYLAVSVGFNLTAMSRVVIGREERVTGERVAALEARMHAGNQVGLLKYSDELMLFRVNFPFNALNQGNSTHFFDIIEIGSSRVPTWRQEFVTRVQTVWSEGGDVWISARVWRPQPKPEWQWTEGDDPRVAWREFPEFFGQFETAGSTPGDDGFLMLAPSEKNRDLIRRTLQGAPN